jgi:hypothetical protein
MVKKIPPEWLYQISKQLSELKKARRHDAD